MGTVSEKLRCFRHFLGKYDFLKVPATQAGGNEPALDIERAPRREKSNLQGRDHYAAILFFPF